MRLKDKVVVITGGGSGIGEATSLLFSHEGAKVVIADWNEESGKRVCEKIQKLGGKSAFVKADISKESEAKKISDAALENFGSVNILVNDAGVRVYGLITEATEESWDLIIGVNLKGVAFCSKAVIPHLIKAGGGSIVNVSSANGVVGRGGMGQYDATKAGVLALSRSMAVDYAKYNIRVNSVCPGPTITQYHINRAKERGVSESELRDRGGKVGILKRWGEPKEIAYGILFLASDEASYVTGIELMVDGGYSAT